MEEGEGERCGDESGGIVSGDVRGMRGECASAQKSNGAVEEGTGASARWSEMRESVQEERGEMSGEGRTGEGGRVLRGSIECRRVRLGGSVVDLEGVEGEKAS